MSAAVQTILVLLIVAGCVGYVGWQFVRTFGAARGKLGSCCSKGCEGQPAEQAGPSMATREHFIDSDSLRRSVQRRRT